MADELRPNPYPAEEAALNAALAKAQGEFPAIAKDKVADAGTYRYSYADLASILATVRPVLAANGLALVQRLEAPAGVRAIRTELRHADGAVVAASFPIGEAPSSPQALGSLLTYLRRYAIQAMLGIAAEDDDDGKAAAAPRPGGASGETGESSPFEPPELKPGTPPAEPLSDAQRRKIHALKSKLEAAEALTDEAYRNVLWADFGVASSADLTKAEASSLIERLVRKEQELGA